MSQVKIILIFVLFFFSAPLSIASADEYSDAQSLVNQGTVIFKSFTEDPSMSWFQKKHSIC